MEKLLKECVRFVGDDSLSEHPNGPEASPKIVNPSDLVGKDDTKLPTVFGMHDILRTCVNC